MRRSARKNAKTSMPHYVMVVEDDAVLGMQIEHILREAGVKDVRIFSTAACSLEELKSSRPEVIILDVHLADRSDGWGIAELVDAIGGGAPRIIFQTGSPEAIPANVAKLGPVLAKPYEPQELVELVRQDSKSGLFSVLRLS